MPEHGDQEASHGAKEVVLERNPKTNEAVLLRACYDALVESHQREGVKIDIVLELLGSAVVLIVLDTPPRGRHGATYTKEEFLNAVVHLEVSCDRDVTSLVHPPAGAACSDTCKHGSRDKEGLGIDGQQKDSGGENENDFEGAVEAVREGRLEPALSLELATELSIFARELG